MPVHIGNTSELDSISHSPVEITLRRSDGSHATYTLPATTTLEARGRYARVLARMQDEIAHGAVVVP